MSPIIVPNLSSLFIMSIMSNSVVEKISMLALGAELGLYITPIIMFLFRCDSISVNKDSKT